MRRPGRKNVYYNGFRVELLDDWTAYFYNYADLRPYEEKFISRKPIATNSTIKHPTFLHRNKSLHKQKHQEVFKSLHKQKHQEVFKKFLVTCYHEEVDEFELEDDEDMEGMSF
jgi:hypothetical protein